MVNNYKKKSKNKKKRLERAKNAHNVNEHPEDEQLDRGDESNAHEEPTVNSQKRQHDDDNSDVEEKPRKKKKKKQPVATEASDKKGKKSIRQMKREKFAERQAESQAAAKDQLKSQCLNYLSQWKHNRQNWKFMKAKQVWLYKNKFSSFLLPDSSWPLLLEYFESAQGNIRNMLLNDANKIIKQMDEWTESQSSQAREIQVENKDEEDNNEESAEDSQPQKPDENVYKRARDLIQCLEE